MIYSNNDILTKFTLWFDYANKVYEKNSLKNFNSFALSTCYNNMPTSRMVLLKDYNKDGFIFFTNLESKKSIEIQSNQNVAMLFYWECISRQIRITGKALPVDSVISEKYFQSRPYLSKIGAWASKQSMELSSYQDFLHRISKYSIKYPINPPKPNYWGGYIIRPSTIEFWHEKSFRLHIRKLYTKIEDDKWNEKLLYP